MRIYLQTPPVEDKPPRYYHLHLQEDLLGGWNLIKESGYQGASGKMTREHYEVRDEAIQGLIKARDAQLRRGYRIVFAEGDAQT